MNISGGSTGKYFAQFGEDRILDAIFHHRSEGHCVEVGANDGISGSMTYHFELIGWNCLLVEPIPDLARKISEKRKCIVKNFAASSSEGEATFYVADADESLSSLTLSGDQKKRIRDQGSGVREIRVTKRTLDRILKEADVSRIDFITIDVEGHELEVLRGFTVDVFQPRIIIVEDNSNQVDNRILTHLEDRGYVFIRRTGVNDWYARQEDTEIAEPGAVALLRRERSRLRFENRIKRRVAFLEHLLPESLKEWVRRSLRRLSDKVFP